MIDQDGITTSDGLTMRWEEVVAANLYKIDAVTKDVTYLTFQHECGEEIEIMNDDPDFDAVIETMPRFLNLRTDWRDLLNTASPDGEVIPLLKSN